MDRYMDGWIDATAGVSETVLHLWRRNVGPRFGRRNGPQNSRSEKFQCKHLNELNLIYVKTLNS